LLTATKAGDNVYLIGTSSVITIKIVDVAADKAAADKAAADKAAADKATADKAAADKAAADKAAADKAAADKAAADKAAADAQAAADKAAADAQKPSEGGGGTAIAKEDLNSIRYSIATKTKTIFIDLADKYSGEIADISVKTTVIVKGKKVTRYVKVDTVTLDEIGYAKIKTRIAIKVGNVIRVSIDGVAIKYVTVK
jgi:chemotaxis protein histidine kinase CheA